MHSIQRPRRVAGTLLVAALAAGGLVPASPAHAADPCDSCVAQASVAGPGGVSPSAPAGADGREKARRQREAAERQARAAAERAADAAAAAAQAAAEQAAAERAAAEQAAADRAAAQEAAQVPSARPEPSPRPNAASASPTLPVPTQTGPGSSAPVAPGLAPSPGLAPLGSGQVVLPSDGSTGPPRLGAAAADPTAGAASQGGPGAPTADGSSPALFGALPQALRVAAQSASPRAEQKPAQPAPVLETAARTAEPVNGKLPLVALLVGLLLLIPFIVRELFR